MNDETNAAKRSRASFTNRRKIFVGVTVIVMVLGIAVMGWRYFTGKTETTESKATPESKRKVLYWTDPMKPDYHSDKPGKSPFMDMEMVPVYADDAGATTVSVRPEIIQSLGVRTHTVVRSNRGITIPSEALIRTGTRNAVVLAIGAGRFQPVDVIPGAESDDWVEIRQGIKAGDVVVTSGQFLIDSEANVRASFSRMQSTEPGTP